MTEPDPSQGPARQAGRGRRLRTVLPLLVAAWLVLEIWLVLQVASVLGGLPVVGLLVLGAVLGGWIIKRAGLRALRSAVRAVEQEPGPGTGESHTAITITAGVLLIVPGFVSDLLALACLFPPTRALLGRVPSRLSRALLRRARPGDPLSEALRLREQLRIHRPDGRVVPGEVVDRPRTPTPPDPRSKRLPPPDRSGD